MNDILLDNPRAKDCLHETLERLKELQIIQVPEEFEHFPRRRSDTVDSLN